jgi:hypothetical protein
VPESALSLAADRILEVKPFVDELLCRDAAFISDADLTVWKGLKARLEDKDTWGTILASYSEFGVGAPLPKEIGGYIDGRPGAGRLRGGRCR